MSLLFALLQANSVGYRMRYCSLILLGLIASVLAEAQIVIVPREKLEAMHNPKLTASALAMKFETMCIQANPMGEDDGIQTFTYPFTNVSEDTLKVRNLVSGCTCMTALCPKMTVPSGESSEIIVKYSPKGHPGRFERKVMVYAGEDKEPTVILRLQVEVDRGADFSNLYPIAMGNIRVRRNEITFRAGEKGVERCPFVNVSGKVFTLTCETPLLPPCLSVRTEPETLQPGQEGEIIITYSPEKGGHRPKMPVIFKGLGLSPMQSSIIIYVVD